MTKAIETAKALTFGTELEYTSISRERAARAIHMVVGGTIRHTGGGYDEWTVIAPDGRNWKAVSDGSLTDRATSAEVVTPILKWDDIETLQAVVRELRKAGAKTPNCTSQHVHIGVRDFTPRQIANFARIWYKQEELILKTLGTLPSRLAHYTRPTDREFIARLEKSKPTMYLIPLDLAAPPLREWVSNSSEQRGSCRGLTCDEIKATVKRSIPAISRGRPREIQYVPTSDHNRSWL